MEVVVVKSVRQVVVLDHLAQCDRERSFPMAKSVIWAILKICCIDSHEKRTPFKYKLSRDRAVIVFSRAITLIKTVVSRFIPSVPPVHHH